MSTESNATRSVEKLPLPPASNAARNLTQPSATARTKRPRLIELAAQECTLQELKFAEVFAVTRNAAESYRASHDCTNMTFPAALQAGWRVSHRAHVQRMVRTLLSEAAHAVGVDAQALIASDRAIVEAYEAHIGELMTHVIESCRWCNGADHQYQWVDLEEFCNALDAADAENESRTSRKQRPKPLPNDLGGYGFSRSAEPSLTCPKCEGRGHSATYFADTRKLSGPAALLFRGVKQKADGSFELIVADYDKAKERLMRATGSYGDDAASVARGAAAGAAAGAGAAQALAARVQDMTEDEARKAYLALVQG